VSDLLLIAAGVLGLIVAAIHAYMGQVRLIAPAKFTGAVQRGMVQAIWHFSALAWAASALVFLYAAQWLAGEARWQAVVLACLPLAYGLVCNVWITRGRHFGGLLLAVVIALALAGGSGRLD
jgi:hypothetical protein